MPEAIKTLNDIPELSEQMAKTRDEFLASQPPENMEIVGAAMAKLMASAFGDNALNVGDEIPSFSLPNAKGEPVSIADYLNKGPLVISFYRGGWCPFCNLEFKGLTDVLPEINRLGASLVGIAPETPDVAQETVSKHNIPFEVLSDVGNKIADQFGLVMEVYEEMRPLYLQWGLDIPAVNGDDTWQLPIPATYVVNPQGKIVAAYINRDYTQRMEPVEIIKALTVMS